MPGDSAQLPPGWTATVDPSSGKTYYANAGTGQTSWEFPTADSSSNAADSGSSVADSKKAKQDKQDEAIKARVAEVSAHEKNRR